MTDKEPEKLARVEFKDGTLSLFIEGKLKSSWSAERCRIDFGDVESLVEDILNSAESLAQRRVDEALEKFKEGEFIEWKNVAVREAVDEALGEVLRRVADASSRDRMFQMIVEYRHSLKSQGATNG